jgi:phospholipid/cholesterol/gamma-HCH transport system substrate-binding protein
MEALEGAVGSADENLKNLQGLTGPLGNRGTVIVANLEQAVRNLEDLLGQVALLTRNLNTSEGTIGLLIRERQLYDQLNATIGQAQATIADARGIISDPEVSRRIKQILYNAWVFSDKIARDPARLARGVVDRETPIK